MINKVFAGMDDAVAGIPDGKPRMLKDVTLTATARGVVTLLMTNLGLFEVTGLSRTDHCLLTTRLFASELRMATV